MCGIVGFIGNTGNNLTRVLASMAAIIYRAPDSTGVTWMGDEIDPFRTRKCIGSVGKLVETMLDNPAYPNNPQTLLRLWGDGFDSPEGLLRIQLRVLQWEGFRKERTPPPFLWDEILGKDRTPGLSIHPGTAGSSGPLPVFPLTSFDMLGTCMQRLASDFDLSPGVTHVLIRAVLKNALKEWREDEVHGIKREDIFKALDEAVEKILWEEYSTGAAVQFTNPYAQEHLWKILSKNPIQVPRDYDRDGVRCLFRFLDAAVVSRTAFEPGISEKIQKLFDELLRENSEIRPMPWKVLYDAEKGVNVYGWAGAAVFEFFKQQQIDTAFGDEIVTETPVSGAGIINPVFLKSFSFPVLSHGRWAMQSPVTVQNAHPFFDELGQRSIVLNGQFNSDVEAELHTFLTKLGFSYKSDNSSESMALLWGYYYSVLKQEQNRSETIRSHVESGLVDYCIGSQNIDYRIYHQVRGKSEAELDKFAFIKAAKQIVRLGGQVAVTGMSVKSPRRLYVASHNRPVFLTWRPEGDAVMVVSDINASIGLFSQSFVYRKSKAIRKLRREQEEELQLLRDRGEEPKSFRLCKEKFQRKEKEILEAFRITVVPLEGEEQFAEIYTAFRSGRVKHHIEMTSFDGESLTDIEELSTVLNPVQSKKDIFKSFYETHVQEIPDRLSDILNIYLPEDLITPNLQIRERFLQRRFGKTFSALKRILLVGMGSSRNAGLMAKPFYHSLFPNIDVVALKPVEVEQIDNAVDPETDLVILCSWSGTTAEMVEFAKELNAKKAVMIGITDKPFADMALIVGRSGGVVTTYSGEEITFTALKSTPCMIYCLDLFAMWLASRISGEETISRYSEKIQGIPKIVAEVLGDRKMTEFCAEVSKRFSGSSFVAVIDADSFSGVGEEAALKIEENSMTTIGKYLDYRDIRISNLSAEHRNSFIIINATVDSWLQEAIMVMKKLYLAKVPFIAVTYPHGYAEEIRFYAHGAVFELPKVDDVLQPFIDLPFFYTLAYQYALHLQTGIPGFPRNRVKSVTTSRSRPGSIVSPARELALLQKSVDLLETIPAPDLKHESSWETNAEHGWERECYRQTRELASVLARREPLKLLTRNKYADFNMLGRTIFGLHQDGGEIVFICMDRTARSAALNIAYRWSRLLGGLVRVVSEREYLERFSDDVSLFVIATEIPEAGSLEYLIAHIKSPVIWVGPAFQDTDTAASNFFTESFACFFITDTYPLIPGSLMYAVLNHVLTQAWKTWKPEKAEAVEKLLGNAGKAVSAIVNHHDLFSSIAQAAGSISRYRSAFYIGPPDGTGIGWTARFAQSDSGMMVFHLYGDGPHGPLATVDPDLGSKYAAITGGEEEMKKIYGEKLAARWEEKYLDGETFDSYRNRAAEKRELSPYRPFFAEGTWYLPALKPEYDTSRDNFIIIEAAGERSYAQALDELSVYGCRYARMLVITQESYQDDYEKRGLFVHPAGDYIFLPALKGSNGAFPVPDFFLPFIIDLLAVAASAFLSRRSPFLCQQNDVQSLIKHAFGKLGPVLSRKKDLLHFLDYNLLGALTTLSPLVFRIDGRAEYKVMKILDEESLQHLLQDGILYGGEEVINHFRMLNEQGEPFYLFQPDSSSFTGTALDYGETYAEEYWDFWFESFGTTWSSLKERYLEVKASSTGKPIIEIPLIAEDSIQGRLIHFYTAFAEWNAASPPGPQIEATILALAYEAFSLPRKTSRYLYIASAFNETMVAAEVLWADWFIVLVQRSFLFWKLPEEIARIIAERVAACLSLLESTGRAADMKLIYKEIEKIWQEDRVQISGNDEEYWQTFLGVITNYFKRE